MGATLTSRLRITADNECDVFVNGANVGSTNNWGVAVTLDVSLFVHPARRNVIAIEARNTSSQDGNDRGIIGELTVAVDGSTEALVVTDGDWRTSKTLEAGWMDPSFDDSAWAVATVVASNGDGPWGSVLTQTTAKWIWSDVIPTSTASKPNLETAWARRAFYFSFDGATLAGEPGCP